MASLREEYQALLDANVGLEKTHEWLESEDEILAKMPLLEREQIKVSVLLLSQWSEVPNQDESLSQEIAGG